MDTNQNTLAITARFRKREDAERAVIELREEGFGAESILAAFGEGPAPTESIGEEQDRTSIPTEAGAPGTTASVASEMVLPEGPMTTMIGGSPFGESSTHILSGQGDESQSGDSTVTVRATADRAGEAEAILHRNNGVQQPS